MQKTGGFTIVEIMIALLLSVVLLGGVVQVYSSSKQSYRVAENVARMQENSRFAMNILTKEIRMAGFSPCPVQTQIANVLVGGSTNATNFGTGATLPSSMAYPILYRSLPLLSIPMKVRPRCRDSFVTIWKMPG